MEKKLVILVCLILLPFVTAQTAQQDNCYNIPFECGNCSFVNITISYPNGSIIVDDGEMSTASGWYYNYTFCNTNELGDYYTSYHYDRDGVYSYADAREISVTESGINIGLNGTYYSLGFLFILFGISGLFFYLSSTMKTIGFRTFFLLLGFLFLVTLFMFSSLIYSQLVVTEGTTSFVSGMIFIFSLLNILVFFFVLVHYIMDLLDKIRDKKGFERDF